jgi:hypothetical protein
MFLEYADRTIPEGDLEMKKIYKRLGQLAASAGLLGIMLAASGSAMAANYNIILKDSAGALLPCATGGFTFDKTTAGTFSTTGASVTLTGCASTFVPGIANGTYTPGALNVVVENVTLTKPGTGGQNEPLDQGPNVEGLTGTLQFTTNAPGTCAGTGSTSGTKTYTITFSYVAGSQNTAGRTYTLSCAGPGNFTTTGNYHVRNLANPVPEPEVLWLTLAGLSALALSRRKRRRI